MNRLNNLKHTISNGHLHKVIICFFTFYFCLFTLKAQDIHFSQFYESTILRNPALTGIFNGDYKVIAQYRSQWNSIGSPFQTALVSGETKIPVSSESSDFFSVGVLGYYDVSGSINLKTLGAYPSVTYHKSLEDDHKSFLSVGFTGGYVQRSYDVSKMTFDNQYGPSGFSQYNPTGENFTDPKINHWDMGAGISFSSTAGADDEATYFIGVSGFHFTRPTRSFMNNAAVRLDMRWNVNAGLNYQLNEAFGLLLQGNYARQGNYNEVIGGGLISWKRAGSGIDPDFTMYGGVFYRFGDAIVPVVKLDYRGYAFGLSYDVNLSKLRAASNLRGGYEISLVKMGKFSNPKWEKSRTLCPDFF